MRIPAIIAACLLVSLSLESSSLAQEPPKADNTAQNKGAARADAITAQKQDNKKNDVKTLAAIRRAIMRGRGLSMDAKNVKILYSSGVVTLKGPVDSDIEKGQVETLVKNCRNVSSIENELTVAPKSH
jgi:hyperosmotically inducible periplasmic protein